MLAIAREEPGEVVCVGVESDLHWFCGVCWTVY
jgi:hypothetical protein